MFLDSPDNEYDLSEFNTFTENDTGDYSKADLERMQEKMDLSTTQKSCTM